MFETFYSEEIKQQLTACLRVMPHHQNTSGFFITIIEKISELDGDGPVIAE
jgi:16S rRNA C967 or C1407 C5-methylase (RsmB/RsmF family)